MGAPASGTIKRYLKDPCKPMYWVLLEGCVLHLADTGPEDGAVCSEIILPLAARRTWPSKFREMGLSSVAPETVPATYFVVARV